MRDSSIVLSDMVEDINRVLPPDEQENLLGWHLPKLLRVRRKYLGLYPNGRRAKTLTGLMIIGPLLAVLGAKLMLGPSFF